MEINISYKVIKFINKLNDRDKMECLRLIDLLKKYGHTLAMPHSKALGGGLFELRLYTDKNLRLFYLFKKNTAIIIYGLIKKTNRIPGRYMEQIKKRSKESQHNH